MRNLKTGLVLLGSIVAIGGCGGGGGGGGRTPPPPPPPPVDETYGVTLTQLELTRTGDGEPVPVNGLPLVSNITVILDN